MRICLYTETALPMLGGQETAVDALARQFTARGHETVVLAPTPRSPLVADDAALPYRVVRHPRFISTRHFVTAYGWFLHRLHRRFAFDVLHCHSVYPTGYLGVLARPRLNVPVVITSHGGDVAESNNLLRKPGLPERHMKAVREADARVAISSFTRAGYQRLAPGVAVHDISNGVDAAVYANAVARPQGLPALIAPGSYLLFLGRLSARKGVDVLLDALATIPAGTRPQVIIAGDGPESRALAERSRRLGVTRSALFLGQTTGSPKTWLLQNAAATVIPSRDWEAFPLVVLESFASGTPVVATRIPGLRDLVKPGATGWLVAPEEPEALAQALLDATGDRAHARQMGETARREAQARDWSAIAARYLTLFEGLRARGRAEVNRGQ